MEILKRFPALNSYKKELKACCDEFGVNYKRVDVVLQEPAIVTLGDNKLITLMCSPCTDNWTVLFSETLSAPLREIGHWETF